MGAEELNNVSARITGLSEATTYRIYILAVDNAENISETGGMGNVSTISSTGEFTTKVQVKTPSITPNGGEYTSDKLQVTMTCATEGVTIYYTTDGTRPTTGSSRYQGAFEVTIPATVKAIAMKSGMADSEVASVSYTKKDIMDYLWIILLGAVVIVAGVGGYVYFIGKKKDDEAE